MTFQGKFIKSYDNINYAWIISIMTTFIACMFQIINFSHADQTFFDPCSLANVFEVCKICTYLLRFKTFSFT